MPSTASAASRAWRRSQIANAPHDCLKLIYQGGDKLFVPVENLDVLSRYGHADQEATLDRLGGVGWQSRKAKVKERIRELAGELIKVAAERAMRKGTVLDLPHGVYEEFAARFPYEETEDQLAAIEAVLEDMGSGRPMDRLLCGDVGFGKTEVALRAAFVAAMAGKQVALLAPTTLLVRQHYRLFAQRFEGLPVRVASLSRFVTAKEASEVKKDLAAGQVDIVIGTHALLGKGVAFKNLGLVIVDEEQHFGVAHKEKLKQLRAEVHVLTMTATPIPRTLHMALGGMKDLSLIATPPVDRLAVRTFVMPADPVVLREALMREHYRGGQSFFVCPRISDQVRLTADLREAGAGAQARDRQRPDAGRRPRPGDERVLRPQAGRADRHQHHRERAGHPDRQYADRPSRRPVRPGPALPAARSRRPLQGPGLRLLHRAGQQGAGRHGRAAPAA